MRSIRLTYFSTSARPRRQARSFGVSLFSWWVRRLIWTSLQIHSRHGRSTYSVVFVACTETRFFEFPCRCEKLLICPVRRNVVMRPLLLQIAFAFNKVYCPLYPWLHVTCFQIWGREYRMCVVSFCTLCRRNVGSSCSARCKITGGTCRSVLHSAWCAILCLFLHHDFISTLWFAASNQGVCCMILWWFLWDRSAFSAWISQATGLERLESQYLKLESEYLKLRSWNRWNLSISSYGAGIGGIWVSQATGLERLDFEYLKLRGWNG